MWGTSSPPTGYLLCNGSEQPIATYPELAALLTTTYGAYTNGSGAAGSSHFRLPDFKARSPIGTGGVAGSGAGFAGNNYGVGQKYGEEVHLLSYLESGFRDHFHSLPMAIGGSASDTLDVPPRASGASRDVNFRTGASAGGQAYGSAMTGNSDAINSHNTVHPVLGIAFIIKSTGAAAGGGTGSYRGTVPALTAGTWLNVTHSLGTEDVGVWIKETTSKENASVDWKIVDANTIALRSASPVAASFLTAVVKA
jgi:microcystin-dependent protein